MNKDGFAELVGKKLNRSKKEASKLLDAVFGAISETLSRGEEVSVSGFGAFSAKERKSRQGVNPRTGEKITIPAMRIPKFQAGKHLKDAVRRPQGS